MANNNRQIRLADFSGGESAMFPVFNTPSKYSALLQNMHISERGTIKKIPGYVAVNSTPVAEPLQTGFEYRKASGTTQLLAAGGGKVFTVGTTLTQIQSGMNTQARVFFTQMNDLCIMSNGISADGPKKWDGTTLSNLGGTPPPTAFKMHAHRGRVWAIERQNKMMASHSALSNPEDWTTSNNAGYIDFRYVLPTGDELLDIATFVDLLVFFFRNHVVIYSGSNPTSSGDFAMTQCISGVGVIDTGTVQALGTDMSFLSLGGVKTLRQVVATGSLDVGDMSEQINPLVRGDIQEGSAGSFSSAHLPRLGWLMQSIKDTVWLYNYQRKAWGRMVGADVRGMFSTIAGDVYITGSGYVYKYGSGWSFAGLAPVCVWSLAWIALDRSARVAMPKSLELLLAPAPQATKLNVSFRYDMDIQRFEHSFEIVGTVTSPGTEDVDSVNNWDNIDPLDSLSQQPTKLPLFGSGRRMQITLSNQSATSIEVVDFIIIAVIGGQ
ncbi:MAG TPA: hypothetical protein VLH56_02815 [Dissulfurispiraceae bacterium]|nr:hypothetical protein [Dissulfurispiraceae bacterium]